MLDWKVEHSGEALQWMLDTLERPQSVEIWSATSPTKDFRSAHWESTSVPNETAPAQGQLPWSKEEFTAAFAQATYELEGDACTLTTLMYIEPPARGH